MTRSRHINISGTGSATGSRLSSPTVAHDESDYFNSKDTTPFDGSISPKAHRNHSQRRHKDTACALAKLESPVAASGHPLVFNTPAELATLSPRTRSSADLLDHTGASGIYPTMPYASSHQHHTPQGTYAPARAPSLARASSLAKFNTSGGVITAPAHSTTNDNLDNMHTDETFPPLDRSLNGSQSFSLKSPSSGNPIRSTSNLPTSGGYVNSNGQGYTSTSSLFSAASGQSSNLKASTDSSVMSGSVSTKSSSESRRRDTLTAHCQAQQQQYLAKIRNNIRDDLDSRVNPGISLADSESDTDSDSMTSEFPLDSGLGGVGTSFDDEYTDIASAYPFLETATAQEETSEVYKERVEWQAMLSSVLNGEILRSEKLRLKKPGRKDGVVGGEELWIAVRAKVCGRTVSEQKRSLDYARSHVEDVLDKILKFRLPEFSPEDLHSFGELSDAQGHQTPTSSRDNAAALISWCASIVDDLLLELEKCESLYCTLQAFKDANPVYASIAFQERMNALIAWSTISNSIAREIELLRSWAGNNELDPSKGDDDDKKESLAANILKQDSLTGIFEFRLRRIIRPLVVKARDGMILYYNLFQEMNLPSFVGYVEKIIQFPINLIQEIIRLRLLYARRLANPTIMMTDQLVDDCQLYIEIGAVIKLRNVQLTLPIPQKGWVFQKKPTDESFNACLRDCINYYIELLNAKLISGTLPRKSYISFKESEQVEKHYHFLDTYCVIIEGGARIIAEQFTSLAYKMLSRLLSYWETQMKENKSDSAIEIDKRLSLTMENVRTFQRKQLRFYRIKVLVRVLKTHGHFLIRTGSLERLGIYVIADPSLKDKPEHVEELISGYCRPNQSNTDNDPSSSVDAENMDISYLLIFAIAEPLIWEGDIVTLPMKEFEMKLEPGRMRLVAQGDARELERLKDHFSSISGDACQVTVESLSQNAVVNNELFKTRRLFYRIAISVINWSLKFRLDARHLECHQTIYNMFSFAREFSQRATILMDAKRRGNIAMKLISLCIEWVTFIHDDCTPTDVRTFRWSVVALEFAMIMTRGVNILAISNAQFVKLREKVSGCMTLLISHFDIMGARSQAAQRKMNERARRYKYSNVTFKDDDELMLAFRAEAVKKLERLEEQRQGLHAVGKVLDGSNTNSDFLHFLTSSFSAVNLRWQQGRFIGGGAFGNVYAAVNLDTGTVMAVKEIRLQDTRSIRHLLKSIKDEMTVLEMLNHPNIVQYYGVEVHRDKVFIFMEYCQGGSLAGLLEYGRIEDEQVLQVYTLQMLEGLAYLHQSGIVHRDIKPENILLDHMGVVKFVDFGAAKVIAAKGRSTIIKKSGDSTSAWSESQGIRPGVVKTKLSSMTGTPMYMSPEVITGADTGRHGSIDIWSLGCCLSEMATGRRPWAHLDNEWAIMYHIAAGHLPQLPSIDQLSQAGQAFLLKCLERNPAKRSTAVELLDDPWIVSIRQVVLGPDELESSASSSPRNLSVDGNHTIQSRRNSRASQLSVQKEFMRGRQNSATTMPEPCQSAGVENDKNVHHGSKRGSPQSQEDSSAPDDNITSFQEHAAAN